jgi:hypothetical protein
MTNGQGTTLVGAVTDKNDLGFRVCVRTHFLKGTAFRPYIYDAM